MYLFVKYFVCCYLGNLWMWHFIYLCIILLILQIWLPSCGSEVECQPYSISRGENMLKSTEDLQESESQIVITHKVEVHSVNNNEWYDGHVKIIWINWHQKQWKRCQLSDDLDPIQLCTIINCSLSLAER